MNDPARTISFALFALFTAAILVAIVLIFRKVYRVLKVFREHASDDMVERVLAVADEVGLDTSGVRKVIDAVIGHKIRDLGLIEEHKWGATTAIYSAQLNDIQGNDTGFSPQPRSRIEPGRPVASKTAA